MSLSPSCPAQAICHFTLRSKSSTQSLKACWVRNRRFFHGASKCLHFTRRQAESGLECGETLAETPVSVCDAITSSDNSSFDLRQGESNGLSLSLPVWPDRRNSCIRCRGSSDRPFTRCLIRDTGARIHVPWPSQIRPGVRHIVSWVAWAHLPAPDARHCPSPIASLVSPATVFLQHLFCPHRAGSATSPTTPRTTVLRHHSPVPAEPDHTRPISRNCAA
jgi:hypothetical protein